MTVPKLHLPRQVAMLTRRCTQRQFLLHNDESGTMKNAIGYIYGLCAIRSHQVVHAVCVMSNHYHAVQTDRAARRSDFAQDFNHFVTKTVNKRLNRRESIWSSDKPGDTLLTDTDAVIDAIVYTLLNPVVAGLVDRVEDWDNFGIGPLHWGKTQEFTRPDFFSGRSDTPEVIRFTPMPPPGLDHLPVKEAAALCTARMREREQELLEERSRPAMGMKKIYKQSPFSTPKKSQPMYSRNPKFAGKNDTLVGKIISAYKFFLMKYRAALQLLKAGKDAIFPPGTLRMCRRLKFASEPPDPGDPSFPRYARYA